MQQFTCVNAEEKLGLIPECLGNGTVFKEEACNEQACTAKRSIDEIDTEWSNWSSCPCGING